MLFRAQLDAYIQRRMPVSAPPLTVSRRRLYILPTASGILFAVLLIVMVLGATNYANNLAFALTFWLGAAALVSMHRTHRNLAGLGVAQISATPVFVGQPIGFRVVLASQARAPRHAVQVSSREAMNTSDPIDIRPDAPVTVELQVSAARRGYQRCPVLRMETVYPMGLFRAWTQLRPDASALVYPHPAGDAAWPVEPGCKTGQAAHPRSGSEEFVAHRRYLPGDSPRRIDWKASARSDSLLITQHAEARTPTHWFDIDALVGMDTETRLSQLALWVLNAADAGHHYGLRLPLHTLGPASGSAHRDACLRVLAIY